MEARLHEREGKAITNFATTLPPGDSDMATQVFGVEMRPADGLKEICLLTKFT